MTWIVNCVVFRTFLYGYVVLRKEYLRELAINTHGVVQSCLNVDMNNEQKKKANGMKT